MLTLRAVCGDVTKPYEFIKFGAMDVTKPYEFIGFGAMDVTKPYELVSSMAVIGTGLPTNRSRLGTETARTASSSTPAPYRDQFASQPGVRDDHSSDPKLAVLKAKIKIENHQIRAGIGPNPTIYFGKWQSGPSPGTPRRKGGQEQKLKIMLSTSRTSKIRFRRNT
jgi:hypothetical protein